MNNKLIGGSLLMCVTLLSSATSNGPVSHGPIPPPDCDSCIITAHGPIPPPDCDSCIVS